MGFEYTMIRIMEQLKFQKIEIRVTSPIFIRYLIFLFGKNSLYDDQDGTIEIWKNWKLDTNDILNFDTIFNISIWKELCIIVI